MRGIVVVLSAVFTAVVVTGQATAPNYHSTCCRPLPPEKMSKLPPDIRKQLASEHCMIGQNPFTSEDPQPNNAIQGPWAAKGQQDWAVLCVKPQELSVRVFWGGKTQCSDTLVLAHYRPNDGHWDDPETVLWPADPKKIRAYNHAFGQAYGGRALPVLDHSGLEVGGEEATTIHYCSNGKWLDLAGND